MYEVMNDCALTVLILFTGVIECAPKHARENATNRRQNAASVPSTLVQGQRRSSSCRIKAKRGLNTLALNAESH